MREFTTPKNILWPNIIKKAIVTTIIRNPGTKYKQTPDLRGDIFLKYIIWLPKAKNSWIGFNVAYPCELGKLGNKMPYFTFECFWSASTKVMHRQDAI